MTDAERQQLNIAIAEALDARSLGSYAWEPAGACPQGHSNIGPERGEFGGGIGAGVSGDVVRSQRGGRNLWRMIANWQNGSNRW